MKITKTSVCVLPIAFLIGYASVPPPATKQIVSVIPSDILPGSRAAAQPFYVNGELETVEERRIFI